MIRWGKRGTPAHRWKELAITARGNEFGFRPFDFLGTSAGEGIIDQAVTVNLKKSVDRSTREESFSLDVKKEGELLESLAVQPGEDIYPHSLGCVLRYEER